MSRIPTQGLSQNVASPPVIASGAGQALAAGLNLAGQAAGELGRMRFEKGEAMRRAEIETAAAQARTQLLRGLDAAMLDAENTPDPDEAARIFAERSKALRESLMAENGPAATLRGTDFEQPLLDRLDDLETPYAARMARTVDGKRIDLLTATLTGELDELSARARISDDPLERAALDTAIEDALGSAVEAGALNPQQAARTAIDLRRSIGTDRLDRDAAFVAERLGSDSADAMLAELRQRAAGLGVAPGELDAMLGRAVAEGVSERVGVGDFESASELIAGGRRAGVLQEGEAASLAAGVREGMGRATESAILRGMREIRSGAETAIEDRRVALQESIDGTAWLLGEGRALQLTVKLNEATRDSVARAAAQREEILRQQAGSVWIQSQQRNLTEPGAGGFPSYAKQTVVVEGPDGEPVAVELSEAENRANALAWGYAQIDEAVAGLMSEDPAERADAWNSDAMGLLRSMPIVGLYGGRRLSPAEAQAMAGFARVAYTEDTKNIDPAIAEQIGAAMASGKATLTRLRSAGGDGPEDTAFQAWFGVYRNLKALGQNGTSDYFGDGDRAFFAEIDRQFTYNLATRGDFWPSVMAAEDALRRRSTEGYSAISIPDRTVKKAARRAAGVGWWTAKANGLANAFVFIGNVGAEASRTVGESGRGRAAEAGRGPRQFDYFPTDYDQKIKNPADVEQYLRAVMQVNARSQGRLGEAEDLAVESFRASHIVVNGWAVNIGSGADASAVMQAADSARGPSQMDRAIAAFHERSGGFEELGVDLDELVMKPEDPGEAGAGWWVIVDRTSGAAVGDPVNGVNRFRIEELAEEARKRLYANAAERSRVERRERERRQNSDADIPIGGTLRRFSHDAADAMSPSGGMRFTPEQIEAMRIIDQSLPRGRDADAIRRLRERGGDG